MYGRGMMGYAGGRRAMVPYRRPFPPRFMIGLVIGGLFLLFVAGPAFHFFPLLFLLIWAVPFLVAPAFVAVARGLSGLSEVRARKGGTVTEESKERELLEALARHGSSRPRWRRWRLRYRLPRRTGSSRILPTAVTWR